MKYMTFTAFLLLPLILMSGCAKNTAGDVPETVEFVNIERYSGKWYEIAKIPNRFQRKCAGNTTAVYTILPEGRIKVKNSCVDNHGNKISAEGIAEIADKNSNSKLRVSFFSIFGYHLFWGDYWILGLDNDYRYAAIGHPERKYGWILSRNESLDDNDLKTVFHILSENGYETEEFEFTYQGL